MHCSLAPRALTDGLRAQDNRKKQRVRPAKGHAQSPTFTSFPAPASPVPGPSHPRQSASFSTPAFPGIHIHETFSWVDSPNLVATTGPSSAAHDEQQFFDRAKRTLEPRETWEDFLKLLNMYSKDIIDTKQLIASAELFLGHGELLSQFKALLGWDDKRESVEYGPPFSIRTGPPELIPPAPVDDGGGPSYRRLPDSVSIVPNPLSASAHYLVAMIGGKAGHIWPRSAGSVCAQRRMGLPPYLGIRRRWLRNTQEERFRRINAQDRGRAPRV